MDQSLLDKYKELFDRQWASLWPTSSSVNDGQTEHARRSFAKRFGGN